MRKTYFYDLIFWKEQTDDTVRVRFTAESYFSAKRLTESFELDGYWKGDPLYVNDNPYRDDEKTITIAELKKHECFREELK